MGTNVRPHGLEGNSSLGVPLNYIGNIDIVWDDTSGGLVLGSEGINGLTFVSEPALVKPKGPIGDLCGSADDLGVLARHLDRIRGAARQKVEVDHSSDDVVLECGRGVSSLVDLYVHSVGVEKEHAMRAGGSMLEIDGVVSVQVCGIGNTVGISGPEGAGIIIGR